MFPEYFRLLLNDTDLSNYDRNDLWEHLQDELELRDIKTVSVKKHPILIPPALVIPICLQVGINYQLLIIYFRK